MGLFDGGNDWQSALQGIGATLQDVGAAGNGGQGNALQAYNQRLRSQQALQNLLGTEQPNPVSGNLPGVGAIDGTTPSLGAPGMMDGQIPPQALALLRQYAQVDPEGTLPMLLNRAMQPHKYIMGKPGETPFDENTGQAAAGYTAAQPRPMTAQEKAQYGLRPEDVGVIGADGKPSLLKETSNRNNMMAADGSLYDIRDPSHPKLVATAPNRAVPKPPVVGGNANPSAYWGGH